MKRIDIVIDLETLSLINTPVIIQFSGVAFDIVTGNIIEEFNYFIDYNEQILNTKENKDLLDKYNIKYDESKLGLYDFFNISEATLKFWSERPKKISDNILYNKDKINIKEAINKFELFISKYTQNNDVYIWSNGSIYDINMICRIYEKFTGNLFNFPLPHYKIRDVRTIIDIASMKENIIYKEFLGKIKGYNHDALSDSIYEAKLISLAYDTLIKEK
jgi:oligoribonuclease (3'-5' exoribonuclease)